MAGAHGSVYLVVASSKLMAGLEDWLPDCQDYLFTQILASFQTPIFSGPPESDVLFSILTKYIDIYS
jgi:hypothetical protein